MDVSKGSPRHAPLSATWRPPADLTTRLGRRYPGLDLEAAIYEFLQAYGDNPADRREPRYWNIAFSRFVDDRQRRLAPQPVRAGDYSSQRERTSVVQGLQLARGKPGGFLSGL